MNTTNAMKWTIGNQTQTEHLSDYCTLGTEVRIPGLGTIEIRQRIRDTQAGYVEGKHRAKMIVDAVNSHQNLTETLKDCSDNLETVCKRVEMQHVAGEPILMAWLGNCRKLVERARSVISNLDKSDTTTAP